jgi:mRNA-degrading endonuclease RelE of RelBE toxin-antitoxin system
MSWTVTWSAGARRELRALAVEAARRVLKAVDRLASTGHGDVKQLRGGETQWRLRVGKYRVISEFDFATDTMVIHHVRLREDAYR